MGKPRSQQINNLKHANYRGLHSAVIKIQETFQQKEKLVIVKANRKKKTQYK